MAALLFGFGLFVLGYLLVSISPRAVERKERLIIAFPLGSGLYTLVLFMANQGIGMPLEAALISGILLAMLAIMGGVSLCRYRSIRTKLRPSPTPSPNRLTPLARTEVTLLCILLAILVVAGTFVPVRFWDVNAEYLPIAREIFLEKNISTEVSPSPSELVRAFPPGYKLLVASGYIVHGGVLHPWARVLSPLYGCLILALLYRMGRRHLRFSRETVLGGLLLCATLPIFFEVMIVPASTICFCFQGFAALYFLLEYAKGRKAAALPLSGIFLGLSYWTSYTGAIFIPCFLLLILILNSTGRLSRSEELRELRIPCRSLFLLISITAAICLPHMLRNYLLFGNPVYPALYERFGGAWITSWSKTYLLPRIVPAQAFYFRPRWEIFHEGFFIQLLFFLSIISWAWHQKRESLSLGLFCLLYLAFYLKFLTWPRSAGVSTKLLLPMLIPASLFAGERLNKILRGGLLWWQITVVLLLLPVWSFIMLQDEVRFSALAGSLKCLSFAGVIAFISALTADLDEIAIWLGVGICLLFRDKLRRKFGSPAIAFLLLFSLSSRPLTEGIQLLAKHVLIYRSVAGYSLWNAAFFPECLPEAAWLDQNLPEDAVIATFDDRTYIYPRRVLLLDSPRLWPMYKGLDIDSCIGLLLRNGVTHICLSDFTATSHPLHGLSPLFDKLGDPDYLPLIYTGPSSQEASHVVKVYSLRGAQ